MKVLHILDASLPNISGYASRSDSIIRNLKGLQVESIQLTCQGFTNFKNLKENEDGVDYYRTLPSKGLFKKLPLLGYIDHVFHLANRIQEIIEIEKPDVMHAHSPMLNGLAALIVRHRTGIPILYEVRAFWEDAAVDTEKTKEGSLRYRLIKSLEQYVFKKTNKISCICEGLKNIIISRGIPESKIITSPNAVDLVKFQRIESKNEELLKSLKLENKQVLAFLGSFFKYEGLEFAVRALPLIKVQVTNVHLLLVGGGNEENKLKKLVSELGLENDVTFTGRVSFNQVNNYYSLADLLVFPRENIRLTQLVTPLKPLESMAMGKPLIASDIGGHRELIANMETGLLFKSEDIDDLASKAIQILNDKKLQEQVILNGLDYVKEVRNWRNTAKCYIPVYEELINAKKN